ncbi:MAG: hypothetical protein M1837_001507 [Sclerophora amabilis]|nr:MAG: hypothetical protein M1837_001507 [Sclerophora amabilis]
MTPTSTQCNQDDDASRTEQQAVTPLTPPSTFSPKKVQKSHRKKSSSVSASTLKAIDDDRTREGRLIQRADSHDTSASAAAIRNGDDRSEPVSHSPEFQVPMPDSNPAHSTSSQSHSSTPAFVQLSPTPTSGSPGSLGLTHSSDMLSEVALPQGQAHIHALRSQNPVRDHYDSHGSIDWSAHWPDSHHGGGDGQPAEYPQPGREPARGCCSSKTIQVPPPATGGSSYCSKKSNQRGVETQRAFASPVDGPIQTNNGRILGMSPFESNSKQLPTSHQHHQLNGSLHLNQSINRQMPLPALSIPCNTMQDPLTAEELAIIQKNPAIFRQTITSLALAGMLGNTLPSRNSMGMGPAHNCHCGESCNCLGCASHPYNQTTMNFVRSLSAVQEETDESGKAGELVHERHPSYMGNQGQQRFATTASHPGISNGDVSRPEQGNLQMANKHSVSGEASGLYPNSSMSLSGNSDVAFNPAPEHRLDDLMMHGTQDVDEDLEHQSISPSAFFHVDYPISCAENEGQCFCGESCTCVGCAVHAPQNHTSPAERPTHPNGALSNGRDNRSSIANQIGRQQDPMVGDEIDAFTNNLLMHRTMGLNSGF